MTILMGLDQHRAQITADWVDTSTGETSRARVTPGHRAGVRQFLGRFAGQELEVALEATTGWRFVVEELHARRRARAPGGAGGDLEPCAGARSAPRATGRTPGICGELLMAGRLPESWIPPDHILDLRARVRLRHTLSEQRGEWQQRIQSVLYHHGCPQRRRPDEPRWPRVARGPAAGQPCAREQVSDRACDDRRARHPDRAARSRSYASYARRQPGCKALLAHYGIGPITVGHDPRRARRPQPVLILPRSGPLRRTGHHRPPIRPAPRPRTPLPPRTPSVALGAVRGRAMRAAAHLTRPRVLPRSRGAPRREPRVPVGRAQTPQTQLSHAARTRRGGTPARMTTSLCALPSLTPMHRGRLPAGSCRHDHVDGLHRPSGRNASPSGITPSTIMSPTRNQRRIVDRDKAGRPRAHHPHRQPRPRTPQRTQSNPPNPAPALDDGSLHR